ncbi:protein of unknown function [Candidatus Hydrogenisulfobacillus filiaventi]|uniref:Uncharacterized protein n=1 Tax=Candidatus Hydrogenisulfobacillus filiaventi TaxID=2707344 RepID=A0A6F8ZIB8_9FIRM|nr:protein of unknown function [Candidatus Hydrogenisulfobacillus filiaventi]
MPIRVHRICGHDETLWVQPPIWYIRRVAEAEPCLLCAKGWGDDPSARRQRVVEWTAEEDRSIVEGIRKGEAWGAIALRIGRSPSSVRDRAIRMGWYSNHSRSSSPPEARPWSEEETRRLRHGKERGLSWTDIASQLGRTPEAARKRWQLVKHRPVR